MKAVRKAVIPAAGFGTRFLPFTRAVPKELIPLVDKPVIQYVVEEAAAAGIDEILIVISSGKNAIQEHFNPVPALEERLKANGKNELLDELHRIDTIAKIHYIYQQHLDGLGDAVLHARAFVGEEPFAVLLGDTVLDAAPGRPPVIGQLLAAYEKHEAPVVALEQVPMERVSRYGVIDPSGRDGRLYQLRALVEKPAVEEAPSNLVIASRYVFTPDIFEELEKTPRGKGNEIQLTDAMRQLLRRRPMYGYEIEGRRYDLGSKMGFLSATVEFGLRRPEFRAQFAAYLRSVVRQLEEPECANPPEK